MEVVKAEIAGRSLSIETGRMAKLANGAVVVRAGDTMVLCTVCAASKPRDGQDFFPLAVEYQEKSYADSRRLLQTRGPTLRVGNFDLSFDR